VGSPKGRKEREDSRTAHDDLSDGAAVDLLREEFASLLKPVTPDAETLFDGAPVEEYVDDYTARLGASGGKPARLIESQVPLRTPGLGRGGASKHPVDLDLVAKGGHFAPENGIVKLEVPEDASGGIRVGPASVVPGGDAGVERVDADTLAYPNVSRDTDLAVNTTATGFETFHQLRSPAAREEQRLRLALPPGATLRPNKGGGAEVVQDGERKLSVSPPAAVDAQGQEVASTMDVDGDTIVIKTPHRGKSVAYPVLVDPEFTVKDDWACGWGSGNCTDTWFHGRGYQNASNQGPILDGLKYWKFATTTPGVVWGASKQCLASSYYNFNSCLFGYWFGGGPNWWVPGDNQWSPGQTGLHVWAGGGNRYPGGSRAYWYYDAPGGATTQIYRADFGARFLYRSPETGGLFSYNGIWSTADNWWAQNPYSRPPGPAVQAFNGTEVGVTGQAGVHRWDAVFGHGSPGRQRAEFGLANFGGDVSPAWGKYALAYMGAAIMTLTDPEAPTLTNTAPTGVSGWADRADVFTFAPKASDPGLGVRRMRLIAPGGPTLTRGVSCNGTSGLPCAADFTLSSANANDNAVVDGNRQAAASAYKVKASDLPEGSTDVKLDASDALAGDGHDATKTETVKVDRSPPVIQLSGSLKDAAGSEVAPGQYTLNVAATDGRTDQGPTGRRSGVVSVSTTIDGREVDSADQPCPQDSCPLNRTVTVNTQDLGPGSHEVIVSATDQLGHEKTETFSFTVASCCFDAPTTWGIGIGYDSPLYGDVTGDGLSDAVAKNSLTGAWSVAASDGTSFGTFQGWGALPQLAGAQDNAVGDVDGDGLADLVSRNRATGEVFVSKSDGNSFQTPVSAGTWSAARDFNLADLEGGDEGEVDLVGRDSSDGRIYAGLSWDGRFESGVAVTDYAVPAGPLFADATGDSGADMIIRDGTSIQVAEFASEEQVFDDPTAWGSVPSGHSLLVADTDLNDTADAVSVDPGTGDVSVAASNGKAFGAAKKIGTFPTGYRLAASDVTGDQRADVIGQQPTTKELRVAKMQALTGHVDASDDWTPASDLPYADGSNLGSDDGEDEADAVQARAAAGSQSNPSKKMKLGMYDERLLSRGGLTNPDNGQLIDQGPALAMTAAPYRSAPADKAVGRLLDRMKSAGVSIVRQTVYWGWNDTGSGQDRYAALEQVRRLVYMIRDRGMRPYLTITGNATRGVDCNAAYNANGIGCTAPKRTGANPDPEAFKAFATAVAARFNDPDYRVVEYGIWNEPNSRDWLTTDSAGRGTRGSYGRYRQLYKAGYAGVNSANPKNRVFIGELAARNSYGLSPGSYLCRTVEAEGSGTLSTDAVAWHPYQHMNSPMQKSLAGQTGIGNTAAIQKLIEGLYRNGAKIVPGKKNKPTCKTAEGGPKLRVSQGRVPPLVFTEFGYLSLPFDGKKLARRDWHTEPTRASWSYSALKQARSKYAAWTVMYSTTDKYSGSPLLPDVHADYGLISPSGEVNGNRPYGRKNENSTEKTEKAYNSPVPRLAYCRVRAWAINGGLLGANPPSCASLSG